MVDPENRNEWYDACRAAYEKHRPELEKSYAGMFVVMRPEGPVLKKGKPVVDSDILRLLVRFSKPGTPCIETFFIGDEGNLDGLILSKGILD